MEAAFPLPFSGVVPASLHTGTNQRNPLLRRESAFSARFARTVLASEASELPGTFWLRLCRDELYRRFLTGHLPAASDVLPITNRRYGRL